MQFSGSYLRDILKFTIPLIFANLSTNLMMIGDRFVLTYYSIEAMNAAAIGGTFVAIISMFFINVAMIATVFVGQYNGIGEDKKIARPIWQMLYLSIFSIFFFVPLAFCTEYTGFFPEFCRAEGIIYQRILSFFSFLFVMSAALSAFFIGRKKSGVIIFIVTIGNLINIVLNIIFVFGINNLIDPMGIAGAAWATVISQAIQVLILFVIFLNKTNRIRFNTLDYVFRKDLFWECVKVGSPFAYGRVLSILAWYILLLLFGYSSKNLSTIVTLEFTAYVFFIFFANGCESAVSSLSANFIGKDDLLGIKKLFKTFMLINLVACIIFSVPLIFCQDIIFNFLYRADPTMYELHSELSFLFYSLWVTIAAGNVFAILCGILISGGDTKFPMLLDIIAAWVFAVLPAGIMFYLTGLNSVREIYTLIPLISITNVIILYKRYSKFHWFRKIV